MDKAYKLLGGRIEKFVGTGVNIADGYNADVMIYNDTTKEAYILHRKLGIMFSKLYKEHSKCKSYTIEFINGVSASGKTFTSIKNVVFDE